jgi:hypothetical protein
LSFDLACLAQPGLEIGGRGFDEFDARDIGISRLSNRCDEAIETVLCVNAAPANCAVTAAAVIEHHLHAFDERRALIGLESSGDARSLLLLAPLFGLGIGLPGCFGFGNAIRFLAPATLRVDFRLSLGRIDLAAQAFCIGLEQRSVGLSGGCAGRVHKVGLKHPDPAGSLPAGILEAAVGGTEQGEEACGDHRSSIPAQRLRGRA